MSAGSARLTRVLVACALFAVVEYAYWASVLLLTYQKGGASLAAIVLLAQLLPAAILAPVLGAIGDRIPRGTALSGAYAAEALCLVVLTWVMRTDAPLGAVVLASAIATIAVSVARPIHYASLPQLAETPSALVRANSVTGLVDGIGVFIGPVIAGVVADRIGLWAGPAVCAVAMVIAALLTTRLHLPLGTGTPDAESDVAGAMAGMSAVRRDPALFTVLLIVGVTYVVSGALEILGVGFAQEVLNGTESTSGVMMGAEGIGVLVGSAAAAGIAVRAKLAPSVVVGLAVSGIPLLAIVLVSQLTAAVGLLTVCGIGMALATVAGRTLMQRATDARLLARVFAVQEAILLLGLALGAIIAPLLIAWVGSARAYAPIGLALILAGLVAAPAVRRLDRRAVFRPDVLVALRRVPFLAAMPPPAIERLSQSAEWIEVPTDTTVITQGDHGDAFYVVDSGRLSVAIDGVRLSHDIHAGDGFGEIALLRDVPRTASVATLEPCRLLRIERDEFLAAVTGSPDGAVIADQVTAAHLERDSDRR